MAGPNGGVQQPVPGVEARAGRFPGPSLIPKLTAIQREHGWLPREELVKLSRDERRPLYEIEGVISFYPHFRTELRRKVELTVCQDLSCWLHGGEERLAELRSRYGDDVEVEFHEVSCLGRCDIAPAVAVNERPAPVAEAETLVEEARSGPLPPAGARTSGERWPNDPYEPMARDYRLLRAVLSGEPVGEQIVAELKESGLRGMGGAGFPTGTKWELVAKQEARPKYAICNADESEPGTFKDRQIMAEQPHLVLEGMLIGMAVTGADKGWVFIRHEYGPEEEVLREEIERLRGLGVLDGSRPRDRRLRLARRLHPRRGVGADRVHGGPPRRAAQQTALPRRVRAVGQADADELGRDVRPRAGDPRARLGVVEGSGGERRNGPQVLRRLGPRRATGRLLRADGNNRARAHRARRRRVGRRRAARLPAGRRLLELPRT